MLPVQAPPEPGSVQEIRPRLPGSSHRGLAGRSDERLVSIAKEGDERAFEVLYERHSPAIHRYCRSLLRATQEAEDVTQEVFVLAISALRRGAEPDAFRPWLYRVAHNACMSHLRMRRPVLVADNGVLVGPAAAAEPVEHHREELRQLLDDIGKLPDVQRGALLLREMDGFSYEQVGEVLGLSLSTVRASIFRARRTLQGLAAARDADCDVIQSELCELADRRGRRGRHITSHLTVCSNCRDFRDGLRRRPTVLGGVTPVSPFGVGGLLLALKGKLLGGAAASSGASTAVATAGGGAGAAKIAAVAASSIALLAGAGVEADHVIQHARRDAAVTPSRSAATPATRAASAASGRATARRTAAGITITAADGIRPGGPIADRASHAAPSGASSRARAHTRVKGAPAGKRAASHAGPRASAPAAASAAPAAQESHGAVAGREHDGAKDSTPGDRQRDEHHGAGDDDKHGSKSEAGSGSGGSSGSSGSGSDRAEEPAESPSPGAGSSHDDTSNRPGTSGGGGGDAPHPSAPSSGSSGSPVPPRPTDDSAGTPATPSSPGTPGTNGTPVPAPDPAPAPDPPPADPPVDGTAIPAEPPAGAPAGDAATTAATSPDPASVTPLTQP